MRLLDDSKAASVANVVVDALEEAGYPFNEAIPGLVLTIIRMAEVEGRGTFRCQQILDEAADMLEDGTVATFADEPDDSEAYIDPEVNG